MDNENDGLSLEEFRGEIPKERVSALKIISLALILGPTLFAVVAGFLAPDAKGNPVKVLMTVNFIMAGIMFLTSMVLPNLIMRQGSSKISSTTQILNKIQGAHILKLALVEGAGLFGCVCVLLGLGYINYLSLVPLYFTVITNLPTEKYLCRQFIVHFKQDRRLLLELGN